AEPDRPSRRRLLHARLALPQPDVRARAHRPLHGRHPRAPRSPRGDGVRILAAYLVFCLFYLGAAAIDLRPPQLLQPSLIDRAIPFLPWTIALYLTTIARPAVDSAAFDGLWLFDVPENCFPSLHVSLAIIAAAYWPRARWIGIAWAIAIAVSTMTTKQHYFVDVAGGIAMGFLTTLPLLRDRRATSSP